MATMRNMMIVILVFQIIQCAISQPLATNTANSLIPEPTHESTIYECLFIDRNLPICDPKLLADSEEDLSDKNISETMQRSKRNTDISSKDVIVYTVEGCLPPRMPISMPTCEGITLSRIIDVQRFRPFVITKMSESPLIFPTIDYSQWSRMIKKIKSRSSKI